jgi:pimeloyl-ACP methyl ester carboxylesterase
MTLSKRPATRGLPEVAPPSLLLLGSEPLRAMAELAAGLVLRSAVQQAAPAGDGHPVLVLPGLGASDRSTALLRRFLGDLGYRALRWDLGRNTGARAGLEQRLHARLREAHAQTGRKVSLVGQSLGGVYARELAKLEPDLVRQVISLGSPFAGHPHANNATRMYERLSGDSVEQIPHERHARVRVKPPVPTTSIYSMTDGVVAWPCSIEDGRPDGESIHLRGGSHMGMAACPAALYLVAERLAQREGQWRPFEPRGWQRLLYGVNDHLLGRRDTEPLPTAPLAP